MEIIGFRFNSQDTLRRIQTTLLLFSLEEGISDFCHSHKHTSLLIESIREWQWTTSPVTFQTEADEKATSTVALHEYNNRKPVVIK